ncbi:MAG: 3D-(3,5/4)-trihydroxycyclohexane-1,2-dione acylhydrolase (decyclizing) [Oceanospirillaceae bacterium]
MTDVAQNCIRLTVAQALIKYLTVQKIKDESRGIAKEQLLFGSAFAIFGHGNVTCLGEQLAQNQQLIPTWRGQNEQSMALAAVAYAKANRRNRIAIATSSVGPGATNMVTAAGVAHTNRLPLLLISGDVFNSRLPDPVLQQAEHFNNPTTTVNNAFEAVTRYWDRITSPEQLMQSLPQAIATLLDPADCGPVFLGLPQDVQGMSYDFPKSFFEEKIHRIRRPQPEMCDLEVAAQLLVKAEKPIIIAGGGVFYSHAENELLSFAKKHAIPIVETIAGRTQFTADQSLNCGPIGPTGSDSANALAAQADVVLAIGTRLQDFVTSSWSAFQNPNMQLISINTARFDAIKHRALAIIADAKAALEPLDRIMSDLSTSQHTDADLNNLRQAWLTNALQLRQLWLDKVAQRTALDDTEISSYAQVIGQVNKHCDVDDKVMTAAGGLPAELNMNWLARSVGNFDIEFGFSCMGYEIAGGWGAKIAEPERDVIVLVGDGSYLIMNSDIYSSVLSGHKMIVIVCDNAGFAVINKLQNNTGNQSFNNLLDDCAHRRGDKPLPRVNFVQHAQSMGANAEKITNANDIGDALARAKASDVSYVIVVETDQHRWSNVDAWWEVGLPETSDIPAVNQAREQWDLGRKKQRRGV